MRLGIFCLTVSNLVLLLLLLDRYHVNDKKINLLLGKVLQKLCNDIKGINEPLNYHVCMASKECILAASSIQRLSFFSEQSVQ